VIIYCIKFHAVIAAKLNALFIGSLVFSGRTKSPRFAKRFSMAAVRLILGVSSGANTLSSMALISASMVCPFWSARCSKLWVKSGSSWSMMIMAVW
jgi:hypothetical protein